MSGPSGVRVIDHILPVWSGMLLATTIASLTGCDYGWVALGDRARIDGAVVLGCDSVESATTLKAYLTETSPPPVDRINRELMYTGRCVKLENGELVTVVGQDGAFRKVQRADGKQVWAYRSVLLWVAH